MNDSDWRVPRQNYAACERMPAYESATFDGFQLQPDEEIRWKQAVADAADLPAVGQLLDYLDDVGDRFTIDHSFRVGGLNAGIALRAGADMITVRDAAGVGMLHDVGKRFFQHIIHIPGKWTDEQFESHKLHTAYGAQMVAAAGLRRGLVHGVGNHHGYQRRAYPTYPAALYDSTVVGPLSPDHLIGTGLAMADVHDAMRSVRPDRAEPQSLEATIGAVIELRVPKVLKLAYRSLYDEAVVVDLGSIRGTTHPEAA